MYKSMQQLSNRQHLVVKGSITSASPVVLTKTEVTHYYLSPPIMVSWGELAHSGTTDTLSQEKGTQLSIHLHCRRITMLYNTM